MPACSPAAAQAKSIRAAATPRRVFITHGEPAAADALRRRITEQLSWPCRVPDHLEEVVLEDVDVVDDVDVVEGCVVLALGSGGGFGSAGKGPCSPNVVSSENIPYPGPANGLAT